jgi:hypothetical protein
LAQEAIEMPPTRLKFIIAPIAVSSLLQTEKPSDLDMCIKLSKSPAKWQKHGEGHYALAVLDCVSPQ